MKAKKPTDGPGDFDKERIRLRDIILAAANPSLEEVVFTCAKSLPMREIAVLVEGDAKVVRDVVAGSRDDIASELRARSPGRAIHELANMLVTAPPTPGHLPCAFIVWMGGGAVDVSVLLLKMAPVH